MSQPESIRNKEIRTPLAANYSANVERTSLVAEEHLIHKVESRWPLEFGDVLDVGAGTGVASWSMASKRRLAYVLATDVAPSMVEVISKKKSEKNLHNLSTQVVDACNLSKELAKQKGRFSHAFCAFMLQCVTTPLVVLREIHEVLRPGGVVGIALWATQDGPLDIWDAACKLCDPNYKSPPPFEDPNAWRTYEELEVGLDEVGFVEIESELVTMCYAFESVDAYLKFWFDSENPCPQKLINSWNGDLDQIKEAMGKVLRERYNGGKDVKCSTVLGTAKKPKERS